MKINSKTQVGMFFLSAFIFLFYGTYAFSQPLGKNADSLTKQIFSSKNNQELFINFQTAKDEYFRDNRYNNFVELLKGWGQKKKNLELFVNYYIGLTRYYQLKFLEEKQSWDEYFSRGNSYRDDITGYLEKVIKATNNKEALNIYSRLILWRFHRDQQDVFAEQSMADLLNSVLEYGQFSQEVTLVKTVADALSFYGEKSKAMQAYKLYLDKVIAAGTKDAELKIMALVFLNEGNIELAEIAFDNYIQRLSGAYTKEEKAAVFQEIALLFAWKEAEAKDGQYAEKIFKKMDEALGKDSFDEALLYLRAYNLEKIKEFSAAKDIYVELISRFPQTEYAEQVNYKIGIIALYINRDESTARQYFEKTVQGWPVSHQGLASLYQLGIITQWEDEPVSAQGYYNKLIENAKDGYAELVFLTKERLAEIAQAKPMDNNIKTVLDLALKPENSNLDMSKVQTKVSPVNSVKGGEVTITSQATSPQSGCMQVILDYIWSGDLGQTKLTANAASFATIYSDPGTKVISLVVMCPYGVLDRSIEIIDVK